MRGPLGSHRLLSRVYMPKVRFRLANPLAIPRLIVLEPWGGEYWLPPGKTYELVSEGDLACPMEIELYEERIVICAFDSAAALMTPYDDAGRELASA